MSTGLTIINAKVEKEAVCLSALAAELRKVIVGQDYLINRLAVGLLANGHVLVEGVPGLAKTLAIKTLAAAVDADFKRIQFTPDLLPADVIGTTIYNPKEGNFSVKKGPIFSHFVLADEINRAPAKVQSALLEAMQERQVTIGDSTFSLQEPFLVMATQNPIEQEGTYPLPEAQVDRFMLKLKVTHPDYSQERDILRRRSLTDKKDVVAKVLTPADIVRLRGVVDEIYLDEKIERYILDVVFATREPQKYGVTDINGLIQYGASPRATISMALAAKAYAFTQGRGYVTPQDIKTIGPDVLRHRIIVSYEAQAQEKTSDDIIKTIFSQVAVP